MQNYLLKSFLAIIASCLFSMQVLAQIPPDPGGDPMKDSSSLTVQNDQFKTVVNNISPKLSNFITQKMDKIKPLMRIIFPNINWVINGKRNFRKSFLFLEKTSESNIISFLTNENNGIKTPGFL
ncbi:MAG: hypothetical protein ABI366_03695 [Ginsengibacter sp.]